MIVAMIRTESIKIAAPLISLIAEVDEFKGAWRALGLIAPDRLSELRKVATIESVGSSTRIEGAKLTDRQVEALLGRIGAKSFASRDEQEVAGYGLVMDTVFEAHAAIPVTENHIRQLHGMLLRYSDKDQRHRGFYKSLPNNVEAFDANGKSVGVVFETASTFETPIRMQRLVEWYRESESERSLHPLLRIAVFVVEFLAIHPFQDGNGRLSRVLTTLLLLKSGYSYVPYSSLESIIEENKEGYYLALRRTQLTLKNDRPDWTAWLTFFIRAVHAQTQKLKQKIERESLMRASLPALSVELLELVTRHGSLSTGELVAGTGAPRGTVKKRLSELVDAGHLKPVGKGRSARYVAG